MKEPEIPQLRTPGVIAAELGEPLARVLYALRGTGIRPIGRAGCLRLYDAAAVSAVRARIAEIRARREASCVS